MNQDQKFSSIISLVLMMATASLGWFTMRDQLALPRIKDLRGSGENPVSEQDVVARLWEDPFQAVQAEVARGKDKTAPAGAHKPAAFKLAVESKLEVKKRVCMLVVPIPGTPFPDDGEFRLRQRYSLVMALAQSGYQPDSDGRHLGYVTLNWLGREQVHRFSSINATSSPPTNTPPSAPTNSPASASDIATVLTMTNYTAFNSNTNTKSIHVPYEWFVAAEPGNNLSVLLVWLQNEFLVTEPLCRLAYLQHTLMPTNMGTNFTGMFYIGPDYSGALGAIVADLSSIATNSDHLCTSLLRDKLSILSPAATAPDAFIGLTPTNHWPAARWQLNGKLHEKLGGATNWTYFKNFIAPDDQLTDLLARELRLRNINLESGTDRVLVLSEADTSYGRALPLALMTSAQGVGDAFQSNASPTATKLATLLSHPAAPDSSSLVIARYLQGLDAQKGFQEDAKSGVKGSASKTTAQALEDALNKQAATAVGDSQLDYSERLAEHLGERETNGDVKAVGVLGGDVYDKLILLRSLRKRFPQALFFTTDLDARLWHPDHLRFTRNMIVASAYPVTAAEGNTGFKMAPFRNGYQMSVFNASRAALVLATNASATVSNAPAPEIYEIGRDGPIRLEPASADGLAKSFPVQLGSAFGRFGEAMQQSFGSVRELKGSLICACLGLMLAFFTLRNFYGHRQEPETPENFERDLRLGDLFLSRTGWAARFVLGLALVLTFFAVFSRGAGLLPGGEPWSWSRGVSIWPTEMVRLIILAAVCWMLVLAWQRYRRHRKILKRDFFQADEAGAAQSPIPGSVVAQEVWDWYLSQATMPRRYRRAVLGMLAYLLIGMSLMLLTGFPFNTQVRGGLAHGLDFIFLSASVGALLLLLFYVLDAVWLSAKLLDRLAEPETIWNDRLVEKSMKEFGVLHSDVEGHLDVQFAAQKTEETGRLIFLPFIIQFFMLVSRNRYFDNWSWPTGLVTILICNVVLAAIAWWLLRRAAAKIKREALKKLSRNLVSVELEIARGTLGPPVAQARKIGLIGIKSAIEAEHRGAYSKWIQDPALLAVLIPTGVLGVLTVLFQALFG